MMIPACWPGRGGSRASLDPGGRVAVLGFTIALGRIVAIDVLADAARLRRLEAMAG